MVDVFARLRRRTPLVEPPPTAVLITAGPRRRPWPVRMSYLPWEDPRSCWGDVLYIGATEPGRCPNRVDPDSIGLCDDCRREKGLAS